MTNPSHEQLLNRQFGVRAEAYVESAVHASGADLVRISEIASRERPIDVLDLGCGGGHVTYAVAPHSGRVVACDLSEEMLTAVSNEAARRGLRNVELRRGRAEALPFDAESFDLVISRFSAHHWLDWEQGLRESRRVLRPRATLVIVDVVAPAAAVLDTHLQAVELFRDPSHVRDYRVAEWVAALERAGVAVT